jgi:hypothetical protein
VRTQGASPRSAHASNKLTVAPTCTAETQIGSSLLLTHENIPDNFKTNLLIHKYNYASRRNDINSGRSGSTSTSPCGATTHLTATPALPRLCRASSHMVLHSTCCSVALALLQLRHAPRLLVTRPHGLYLNLAMRRDYSSPGCIGSTPTTSCTVTTHLPTASALHQLCCAS